MYKRPLLLLTFIGLTGLAQAGMDGPALASVDLASVSGAAELKAVWRFSDTTLREIDFHGPDANGQPDGDAVRTYDFEPHAGARDFNDSAWTVVDPSHLTDRRGRGKVSFVWYRTRITVPERIDGTATIGSDLVFRVKVDDYAEIWVDGELSRSTGQRGGSVVAGWNADNRLVIGRNVKPGQEIQLAVFGINGPISNSPTNFIYLRQASVEVHPGSQGPIAVTEQEVNVAVERLTPALDRIVPSNPKVFKLAEGFEFIEGPVWNGDHLLFSDPNANRIYSFREGHGSPGSLTVYREHSGYQGADADRYSQPGSNGLALDERGRLTIDEHGNRRVTRLEADGQLTVLADRYQGKRLNSPNDLVYGPNGQLYFTDPPFGLPKFQDDPEKELEFSGVYRIDASGVVLLDRSLKGPNGLAFSPDGKYLYVTNWDPEHKTVTRFSLLPDGNLGQGAVFFEMTGAAGEEALDGLKVDHEGNLYVSGPGGVWIISDDGEHLGTLRLPRLPANFAWGGSDGRTLYFTARSTLYRMNLGIPGSSFSAASNTGSAQ